MISHNHHHHHSIHSFLVIIISIILLILGGDDVPFCLGREDTNFLTRYNECNRNFHCGDRIDVGYPFWGDHYDGGSRPKYCGLPDYKLDCLGIDSSNNGVTEIKIQSVVFRVRYIDSHTKVMGITRKDFMDDDDACPAQFKDSTYLNSTLFSYTWDVMNVALYLDCDESIVPNQFPLKFKCQTNDTTNTTTTGSSGSDAYFWFDSSPMTPEGFSAENLSSCTKTVRVTVLAEDKDRLMKNASTLPEFLKSGVVVSYNVLENEYGIRYCGFCGYSSGACGYYDDSSPESLKCFCPNDSNNLICDELPGFWKRVRANVSIGVAATVGGVILALSILKLLMSLGERSPSQMIVYLQVFGRRSINNNDHQNLEAFFRTHGSISLQRFSYKDVKRMTNSFKEKLGEGGYGSVFKGQLHDMGLVAVKVLFMKSKSNGEEFLNEVGSISKTSHVNIVTLLGFCFDKNKRALIYEYMPNGSLDKFIYSEKQLQQPGLTIDWETLYQIAIGIARGLEYLHRGCSTRILHFDIKPHNILLDKNFRPKISDFGLAKLCPGTESIISMQGTRGTAGYIAPEVFSRNFGCVSHKSDVYSYGMMVLEMVGGRKNIDVKIGMDHSSQLYFPHWIYDRLKQDQNLCLHGIMTEEKEEAIKKLIIVGLWCIQTNPSVRPPMSKVLEMLEGSIAALQIPPKPFLSSPQRSQQSDFTSSTISIS